MAFPSQFSDIYNDVIATLRLDTTDDVQRAKDAVNVAYTRACVETEALPATETLTLTPGTTAYTLPSDISRLKTLVCTPVGGYVTRPLLRKTLDQMLTYRSAAAGPGTNNGTVYAYCLVGLTDLEVYPAPQGADVISFYYTKRPTPLSADSDVPVLPEPYATDVLKYGACARLAQFSGDPLLSWYQQLSDDAISRLREHINRLTGRLTGQFNIQDDKLWPPHDPSVDVRGTDWNSS